MVKCKECGVELIIGKNWTEGRKNNYRYLCKSCSNKEVYSLRKKNRNHYSKVHRNFQKKFAHNLNEKIKIAIGAKCIFCGYESPNGRNHAHEIHGKKHPSGRSYIFNHKEDFIPLCRSCHRCVHFCINYLGLTWEDILELRNNKYV